MYKDKALQKEVTAARVKRHRALQKGVTSEGVTLLKRPNGADYNPDETMSDGTKRYMGPFSGGQVLDRLTCKPVKNVKPAPTRARRIVNKAPPVVNAMVDTDKRRRLIKICASLKNHGQLSNVYYGIGGPDMGAVAEMLEVTG